MLVTGAAGMLGRRVAAVAEERGHAVTAVDRPEGDLTQAEAARALVAGARPQAIVNCAAWTDVDGAEEHEQAALRVNADAAGHLAAAADEVGARIVHVSTDYVFDGRLRRPYVESDPPSPASAYGRTKLEGERRVAAAASRHTIVRTAWLFGAGGRNFVDTMLRLAEGRDEVRVVHDQIGSPTWTGHLAGALVELAEREQDGVHHVAGAGRCSWYELAVEAFDRAGVSCRVVPTTTAEFPRPAPRPAWSVLGSERPDAVLLPAWEEGLAGHLAERTPVGGTT